MEFIEPIDGSKELLSKQAYKILKENIINNKLKPKTRLIETEIAQAFGISRTPVREAITRLNREGLVKQNNRGVYVREISTEDILDIYELREILDLAALRLSYENFSEIDFKKIEIIIREGEKNLEENNMLKVYKQNTEFHKYFHKNCGNSRLSEFLEKLYESVKRYRILSLNINGSAKKSIHSHKKILKELKKNNLNKACSILKNDIRNGQKNAFKVMEFNS